MDLSNPTTVRMLMEKYGFHFSKAYGQNFLIDSNIVHNIVAATGANYSVGVMEIGPGFGTLTAQLAKVAKYVVSVEIDSKLLPVLQETLQEFSNVKIVQSDILKVDIPKLLHSCFPPEVQRYHVCANLPYYITTPVLAMLIETEQFESITVMVQKEVAARICASANTADYGAFSVFAQFYTDPTIDFHISASCFMPRPKVDSSVITMRRKTCLPLDGESRDLFFRIVKGAFVQRRKTLQNALHAVFGQLSKETIADCIMECGFDIRIRGEVLSVNDFACLTQSIKRRLT